MINDFRLPIKSKCDYSLCEDHTRTHVLMLIPHMVLGGADLFNLNLVKGINKNDFRIGIITTVNDENVWRDRFEEFVDDIFALPEFLEVEDYAEFISHYIISREIDTVFISNSYYGYYLAPWLRMHFPKLQIIDYVHMEEKYWRNGGYARTSSAVQDVIEKTYVCNEHTRQVMIDDFHIMPEKIETIYIGVDSKEFDETKISFGQVRKKYSFSADDVVILFPCRLHPQKRPFFMIEIARMLRSIDSKYKILVVGDGPDMEEMVSYCGDSGLLDTIIFAGRHDDMIPFYKDSDITLICSIKEGLALTAYESLAMGTPVVTSDVGGQSELVNDDVGRVISLCQDEKNIESRSYSESEIRNYVDAIIDITSNKERYGLICSNCRRRIKKYFSIDIMIDKMSKVLKYDISKNDLRSQKADELSHYSYLVDDLVTIYNEYELSQQEIGFIWNDKERIVNENNALKNELESIKNELESIKNMRTWRMVQKYIKFMDETKVGKLLSKVRDGVVSIRKKQWS